MKMNKQELLPVTLMVSAHLNALDNSSDNPMVAVWYRGVIINCEDKDYMLVKNGKIKHYPFYTGTGSMELMNKGKVKRLLGIDHLNVKAGGYRFFVDTSIGDVLYMVPDLGLNPDAFTGLLMKDAVIETEYFICTEQYNRKKSFAKNY
jgi:hypothetical protein